MVAMRTFGRRSFAALLFVALVAWSLVPSSSHASAVFETIQNHLETIADHGHSHGFEEDLYWAMHGHSHDAADHDHSQALLMPGPGSLPTDAYRGAWRLSAAPGGPYSGFLLERPPRA